MASKRTCRWRRRLGAAGRGPAWLWLLAALTHAHGQNGGIGFSVPNNGVGPILGSGGITVTSNGQAYTISGSSVSNPPSGVLLSLAGLSGSNIFVGGVMFVGTTSWTNLNGVPGTLTNLGNYSVPAHTLTNNGDRLMVEWGGTMPGATANTNDFQITWGGTTVLDTGLQIASNTTFRAWCEITRTGTSAQHVEGRLDWGPGGAVPFSFTNVNAEMTINAGVAQTVALKGSAQRVGAHTNNFMSVHYRPGPR